MGWQVCPEVATAAHRALPVALSALLSVSQIRVQLIEPKSDTSSQNDGK